MTDLTLRDFNAIASGKYNAGIVDYQTKENGDLKLVKLNNFVFRTSKNNKTLPTDKILDIKECGVNGGSQKSSGLDEILG
ncbi:MAG: hypothetical protein II922_11190 [Succinimonas sp.]|nr:hypothetical protein [Succinimonas sp.]